MDNFSLLHCNIKFFYTEHNESSQDVDKYFFDHNHTFDWIEFGNLFRQLLPMDFLIHQPILWISPQDYKFPLTKKLLAYFGKLSYEDYKKYVQNLQPIYEKCWEIKEQMANDYKNFQWLGSNVEALQISMTQSDNSVETSKVEQILLVTALLEYGLGNVFYTKSNGKSPPHLLRDLLSTDELLEVFGWEAIWFLKVLLGSPQSINLRNIVWHGFPQPLEMPQYFAAVLIVAINTLGVTIAQQNMQLTQRPQIADFIRYQDKIKLKLPPVKNINLEIGNALTTCSWLPEAYKIFWLQILRYYEMKNWWQLVMLILPQIELLLRLLYAQANEFDVRAKLDEYYITIDSMFEITILNDETRCNQFLVAGRNCMDEGVLKLIYDLFVAPSGPRVRDKVSHGEVTWQCINSEELSHILMQLSLQLLVSNRETHALPYESQFHLNSQAWQCFKDAKMNLLQLIPLTLSHDDEKVVNELVEYLQKDTSRNIKIFQRPKGEAELMQLILRITQLLSKTCNNYSESVTERCLLLSRHALHSKRRRTLEKMLSTLPEVCKDLCKVLQCIEQIFFDIQLKENENKFIEKCDKNRKFLKRTLTIAENFSKYSSKESNEWIKASELCQKFRGIYDSYIGNKTNP